MDEERIIDEKYRQVGRRIRDAREKLGLTQSQLASAVGFQTATAISLIEDGKRRVKLDDLEKISDALNVDVTFLLNGTHPTSVQNVTTALRADRDLTNKDVQQIENFIKFIKDQRNG